MKRTCICVFLLLALSALASSVDGRTREAGTSGSRVVRLVAYNVGVFSKSGEDSTRGIADMMLELGADAVALCEQDSCNRRHPVFQTREFALALGPEWDCRYGSAMQWNGGSYGTGVAVATEILSSFEIRLPKGNGYEPRVCVVAETEGYVIAAVHLDHSSEEVRMEQAKLITDELMRRYRRSRKPVFLCGDLNATPDSQTLSLLSEDWKVLSRTEPTYPADAPEKCIDYILMLENRARVRVLETAVCTDFESADVSQTSDHLPVFAAVRIR